MLHNRHIASPDHKMPATKKLSFADLAALVNPVMFAHIENMVVAYVATRKGVSTYAAQHAIDTNVEARASFERKMIRAVALLAGPGGFQLMKKQTPLAQVPPPAEAPDVTAMLANIAHGNKGGV